MILSAPRAGWSQWGYLGNTTLLLEAGWKMMRAYRFSETLAVFETAYDPAPRRKLSGRGPVRYVQFAGISEHHWGWDKMVKLATVSTLAELGQEMARAGRSAEEAALREAVRALSRPARGFLTTGRAAEQLGVSIPTVKRWIQRGTLDGGPVEGRWLVATESVERILRVREVLRALDDEGNPTPEEIRDLYARSRRARERQGVAAP